MQRRHIEILLILVVLIVSTGPALGTPNAAQDGSPADSADTVDCRLSQNYRAFGPNGNGGIARQWLLGQCALARATVITYVDLASTCSLQKPGVCQEVSLLGACGGVQVSLVSQECQNCQLPVCIDRNAICTPNQRCSNNTNKLCNNSAECSFSRPSSNGACPSGSQSVANWAAYYTLLGGSGQAPFDYCTR